MKDCLRRTHVHSNVRTDRLDGLLIAKRRFDLALARFVSVDGSAGFGAFGFVRHGRSHSRLLRSGTLPAHEKAKLPGPPPKTLTPHQPALPTPTTSRPRLTP